MVDIEGLTTQLINEYSSILETSLVFAILSDFNLSDPSQLEAARAILDELRKSAREEEATGFDASASSGADALAQNGDGSHADNDTGSGKSLPEWSSTTDDTELTHGMSTVDIGDSSTNDKDGEGGTYGLDLDGLDQETKESMLVEMFPGLKPFNIRWTLKKEKWDIHKAINDLMTQSFMEETGTLHRGIEAFSETDLQSPVRKGRGKKRRTRAQDDLSGLITPTTPDSPIASKWDIGKQDVEFIAIRAGKSHKEVGSLYHKNGASIPATILAILEAQAAKAIKCDDPLIQSSAIDLGHEFPTFPAHLLEPLIEVTHPSIANAHELAKALMFQPASTKPSIQLEFQHAALQLDPDPTPLKSKSTNTVNSGLTLHTATGLAKKYTKEREEAFTQAQAAYRKGKSDHLMGGAAAYYSELGRAADSRLKSAQSAAADALVASQSSRTELDLHGVNVQDGKRIAKERVTTWWHELGESRKSGRGIAAGYRIVTGVGYHSEGGKSKLAPAILKMLMNDGWKVQVETGVLVVTGIAQK